MNLLPEAPPLLSLVIPFYNESETLEHSLAEIERTMAKVGCSWEIVAVNDGSRDDTLDKLLSAQQRLPRLIVVDMSRNFGKEAALSAGLKHSNGQAVIPLDADLQDPPELISKMLNEWRKGAEVVLARRANRDSDSRSKRLSANLFYRLINQVSEVAIPENVGDFRLMDRVVVEAINRLPESCRFMKGLFAWVGFRTVTLDYSRPVRQYGNTKFNSWRLWNLALEGITSFSTLPLRVWTYIGISISLIGFAYAVIVIARTLISGVDVPGYASLLVVILTLGGVQLIGLGVLGEYMGRIYIESKHRPAYVVRKVIKNSAQVASRDAEAELQLKKASA